MAELTFNRKKWLRQLPWLLLFGFFFSVANNFQPLDYALYSSLFDTLSMFVVYFITSRILFKRFYKRPTSYLVISLFVVIGMALLFFLINVYLIPRLEVVSHRNPPVFVHFVKEFMMTTFVYFIATSVSLLEHNSRLVENEKLLTKEKLETELKLLKAQIDPHFIFNALNNIYSLTYMKAQNAPDAVLKLSEMLRYVFYECDKDRVPLSSEIKYIENFNSFQQMKSENTQNISLETHLSNSPAELAPMLYIPFIENAFKYSRIEEQEDAWVKIELQNEGSKISFVIENTVPGDNIPASGSGMGIGNVRHRLEIIYPGKHELKIKEAVGSYRVELEIEV